MKLYQNTMNGRRYKHWTRLEAIAYFVKGAARELRIAPSFFFKQYEKTRFRAFKRKWLRHNGGESYFDFKGAKLPDISASHEKMEWLIDIFENVLLIPCYYDDNYAKKINGANIVEYLDPYMSDGPCGYIEDTFDATVKKNDVVIDAGAWLGDFSAYAVSKGATVYAFEPVEETFQLLCKTRDLNLDSGQIYPVQKGLGDSECEIDISIDKNNSVGNSVVFVREGDVSEKISITILDKFVEENKLVRVDFIKADIEGAERELLRGATMVLKNFAPKLSICTYHLPDDPEVLEKIIMDANPAYTVIHLKNKLFAAVK
jgi:FkbM family methyltransferase